jgi:nucleotide-binding universal stress UspA family protein
VLGSVANDLIAHVHEPVVLVGPDVDPHSVEVGDRVVVCVDGGPVAEAAIAPAVDWARRLGVPLEIVTVVEPVPARTDGGPVHRMHGPSDPERYLHDLLARLDRPEDATTKIIEDPVSVPAGLHSYLRDDPAVLVVLTRDLHRDGARFAMGDRSATIVRRSPVPVLAVPA